MKILFVAGFGPISKDQQAASAFYLDTLGLEMEQDADGYTHTDKLAGANAFSLWPLAQAAQSCFGTDAWPEDVTVPQAWLEFDVEDIDGATNGLTEKGYKLLVSKRTEPWGQIVTRLLGPEGLLVGITVTPWMRESAS
jgi:hypothetical protein